MWIFLNNSFISAVQHRDLPDHLMVRARIKGDLERFLHPFYPDNESLNVNLGEVVHETPSADYRFRISISKLRFKNLLSWHASQIDYTNFKSSIDETGPDAELQRDRHAAYMAVWSVMNSWQRKAVKLGHYLKIGNYVGSKRLD